MSHAKRWFKKLNQLFESADARSHIRIPADFQATLAGPFGCLTVTGVDANRDGAGVQSEQPLAEGTLVFLRIADLDLMGFAHVRHYSPREGGYLLGLKFREKLARERLIGDDFDRRRLSRDAYRVWDESEA